MSEHKIILLSMVKNETRIIERLMNSVVGRIDGIVICDTGSTDDTVEKAKAWLDSHDISGAIYNYPFKNFGASRTQSFVSCQDWVKSVGWDATKTWALVLDGDMMLSDQIDRNALEALGPEQAGVSLKQSSGSLIYSNMRVMRCSEPWICKGGTHEAWTCPPHRHTKGFDTPVLIDHGDGGCKSDKYPRDIRLLTEDLAEMPNDARTHFYLGQTYLCMRDWPNAIETLKKRIAIGGWDEEVYIARLYLGECYENSGQTAEAIKTYLEAWQARQHRTEAVIRVISIYRKQPKSQFLASMILEKLFGILFGEDLRTGMTLGQPVRNNDVLFVNYRDMDFQLWEELAIIGFYSGLRPQTWLQLDQLDLKTKLNWHEFNGLLGHMHWYDWCLKPRRQTRFQVPLERLPWATEVEAGCWQPFNPSIRVKPDGSGYLVNLRCANYYTAEAKHYHYRAFHGQVLTRNCLMDVPREAGWNNPKTLEEIKISDAFPQHDHYIRGVEDCRLIQGTDAMEFLGTSQSYSDNKTNKIFHVWRGAEETTWSLKQMALPAGVSPGETQKNWLGFKHEGQLLYIYNFSPFRICDAAGNVKVEVATNKGSLSLREYRGSAGPAPWKSAAFKDEAYLCVMHKVYIGDEGRRYYHRFMTLDSQLKPSRVSCFVRFTKERVEYWSGMCPSLEGDSYWITYGTRDSEAYIAEMLTADIEPLLMYNMKTGAVKPTVERLAVIG
jgi:glycosyltransferase involved in cell wall biosynthesis